MRRLLCLLCLFAFLLTLLPSCGEPSPAEGLTPKALLWSVGGALPAAGDFFALPEGCEARYETTPVCASLGDYHPTVIVTDAKGREFSYEVSFTLLFDEIPPVMSGVKDLSISLGESVAYRAGVTLSDNCDAPVTLEVINTAVDLDRVGSYPVVYIATDAAGNRTTETVTLYVYEESITEEGLYFELDPIIANMITPGMSLEEQVRAVHRYVYGHISYASTSDKGDWVRAAHTALFVSGRGDCFSYFAACKAFFTRLGIEHMDIQRTPGIVAETHYWHLVNIGTSDLPRWYHVDATPLQNAVPYSGCLLTDAQISAYNETRYASDGVTNCYFYAYDAAAYPRSAETTISAG